MQSAIGLGKRLKPVQLLTAPTFSTTVEFVRVLPETVTVFVVSGTRNQPEFSQCVISKKFSAVY